MFRIDTHSHFTTPALYKLSTARGVNQAALADWTPAKMLQQMEEGGVATSIISISDPGVHFGDNAAARALARECNEYAATVVRDIPDGSGSLRFFRCRTWKVRCAKQCTRSTH